MKKLANSKVFGFIASVVLSVGCGNQATPEAENEIPLPDFSKPDSTLSLAPGSSEKFYGTTLVWNPNVDAQTLANVLGKVEDERRFNFEFNETKLKSSQMSDQLDSEKVLKQDQIASLRGQIAGSKEAEIIQSAYRTAWGKAQEYAQTEWLIEGRSTPESEKSVREYCEGVVWKYALSEQILDESYTSMPPVPPICSKTLESGEPLLSQAATACQPDENGKNYTVCYWQEGVMKSRYFTKRLKDASCIEDASSPKCKLLDYIKSAEFKTPSKRSSFVRGFLGSSPKPRFKTGGNRYKLTAITGGNSFEKTSPYYKLKIMLSNPELAMSSRTVFADGASDLLGRGNSFGSVARKDFARYLEDAFVEKSSEETIQVDMNWKMYQEPYWVSDTIEPSLNAKFYESFNILIEESPSLFGSEELLEIDAQIAQQALPIRNRILELETEIQALAVRQQGLRTSTSKARERWLDYKVEIAVKYLRGGAALALWDRVTVEVTDLPEAGQTEVLYRIEGGQSGPSLKTLRGCYDNETFGSVDCKEALDVEIYIPMEVSKDVERNSILITKDLEQANKYGFAFKSKFNGSDYNHLVGEELEGSRLSIELFPRRVSNLLTVLSGEGKIMRNGVANYSMAINLSTTNFDAAIDE